MAFKYGTTSPTAIKYGTTNLTVLRYGIPNYTILDYIEATGSQYIDSGIKSLTSPYSISIRYMKTNTDTSDQCLFGQRQFGKYTNIYNNYYESAFGNTASGTASGDNSIHTIYMDNQKGVYKDGTLLLSGSIASASSSYSALICAFSEDSGSNAKWFFKGRIYEINITNAGSLYRNFIPAKRNSDNAVGLYEVVTNTFYSNNGSGSFVAGTTNNSYALWGKPYSLTLSAGSNTSISVVRTSSLNQHAFTGPLSSGSIIYYGDTLTISYSVSSGYNINTHTVNGSTFTSGTSHTVIGAVTVVTSAVASTSWHTVWTGSTDVGNSTVPTSSTTRSKNVTISGLQANTPTRVTISTITFYINNNAYSGTINKTLNTSCGEQMTGLPSNSTQSEFSSQSSSYLTATGSNCGISIDTPTVANTLPVHDATFYYKSGLSKMTASCRSCVITKVEQYY